ncbi:MAG: hypothetical protein R2774_00180 [Saprospiraceae bacterium]
MKKFSFFPVLLVALFMVLGITAKAQELVPPTKGLYLVEDAVINLKKTANLYTEKAVNAKSGLVTSMKIRIGEMMLEPLKSGVTTSIALSNALSQVNANTESRRLAVAEVESFYKNLLRKS